MEAQRRSLFVVPLARYLEERAEADAMMTQQVTRDCSDAGLASYLAAAARSPEQQVLDVSSAIGKVLARSKTNPLSKTNHKGIRFRLYQTLARLYGYHAERITLPLVAGILVKACFPGMGQLEWTGFIPSATRQIYESETALVSETGKRLREPSGDIPE